MKPHPPPESGKPFVPMVRSQGAGVQPQDGTQGSANSMSWNSALPSLSARCT